MGACSSMLCCGLRVWRQAAAVLARLSACGTVDSSVHPNLAPWLRVRVCFCCRRVLCVRMALRGIVAGSFVFGDADYAQNVQEDSSIGEWQQSLWVLTQVCAASAHVHAQEDPMIFKRLLISL